ARTSFAPARRRMSSRMPARPARNPVACAWRLGSMLVAFSFGKPGVRATPFPENALQPSGDQLIGNLRRAEALDDGFRRGIVGPLQHGPLAEALAADDDGARARRPALLRMDGVGRHEVDLALRPDGDGREPHLGIAGAAAVIDTVIALQALRSVEHAVEHP